jgi:hypothetical protein
MAKIIIGEYRPSVANSLRTHVMVGYKSSAWVVLEIAQDDFVNMKPFFDDWEHSAKVGDKLSLFLCYLATFIVAVGKSNRARKQVCVQELLEKYDVRFNQWNKYILNTNKMAAYHRQMDMYIFSIEKDWGADKPISRGDVVDFDLGIALIPIIKHPALQVQKKPGNLSSSTPIVNNRSLPLLSPSLMEVTMLGKVDDMLNKFQEPLENESSESAEKYNQFWDEVEDELSCIAEKYVDTPKSSFLEKIAVHIGLPQNAQQEFIENIQVCGNRSVNRKRLSLS